MKNLLLLIVCTLFSSIGYAQVGIGTTAPDAGAALDIVSTDKGILIPRLETTAVTSPTDGMMIYSPMEQSFYYYKGGSWENLGSGTSDEVSDADGDTKVQVEATPDDDIIRFMIKGTEQMKIVSTTFGTVRTEYPGNNGNIANGSQALLFNVNGSDNIANGNEALKNNTTGINNIANGNSALLSNSDGDNNIANGTGALYANTSGNHNQANGLNTLRFNTGGDDNIANGNRALYSNTTGSDNIANGYRALYDNQAGENNIAIGREAGYKALGSGNMFLGPSAGFNETGSNKLYINNDAGDENNALIYGEFDNDLLRVNGAMEIVSDDTGILIPKLESTAVTSPVDGMLIYQPSDLSFHYYKGSQWEKLGGQSTDMSDADGDTEIHVEKFADEDKIRFDLAGNQALMITGDSVGRYRVEMNPNKENLAFGQFSLLDNTTGEENVAIGRETLSKNTTGTRNIAIGTATLARNTTADNNIAIGHSALVLNVTGSDNIGIGRRSLIDNSTGFQNIGIGLEALLLNNVGDSNIGIGYRAGSKAKGSGNIFLGNQAGENELGSNKLYISNDDGDAYNALIYGEFDNDLLRVNGAMEIVSTDKGLLIPKLETSAVTSPVDGMLVYQPSDKTFHYYKGNQWEKIGGQSSVVADADNDTQVHVEKNMDEDKIRFDLAGTEKFVFESNAVGQSRILMPGNQFNLGLGDLALDANTSGESNNAFGDHALRYNTTGSNNTALGRAALGGNTTGNHNYANGFLALRLNTTGSGNIANGNTAMYNNVDGENNIAMGTLALVSNVSGSNNLAFGTNAGYASIGSGNVFLGHNAGQNETGSNRLYINNDSGDANNALIYGEFDTDRVQVNGNLGVRNAYPHVALTLKMDANDEWLIHGTDENDDLKFGVKDDGVTTINGATTINGSTGIRANYSNVGLNIKGAVGDQYIFYIEDQNANGLFSVAPSGNVVINGKLGVRVSYSDVAVGLKLDADEDFFMYATDVNDDRKFSISKSGHALFDGSLSVGTSDIPSGYKLSVKGKIVAEEIKVALQADWPDYVFADTYELMPLAELKNSIEENHHLPGIPSADQMEEEGILIGDMQTRMMEKIEELTLYILDLNEKIEQQNSEIQALKASK